jgi:hypothetical protein
VALSIEAIEKEQETIEFKYNVSLIGSTDKDKEYVDPDNKEMIWPEGHIRINHARWQNSTLGINDPNRSVHLETFDGEKIEFHSIQFFLPEELEKEKPAVKDSPMMKAFTGSPFYDVSVIDTETGRYLNAMDATTYAFQAWRKSFNPEEQQLFQEWKKGRGDFSEVPENSNFETNSTEPRSVWQLLSEATTEDLFKFKLDVFEQEVVQNSENRELRSKIRKSKSICEVCAAYQALLDEESEEAGSEE